MSKKSFLTTKNCDYDTSDTIAKIHHLIEREEFPFCIYCNYPGRENLGTLILIESKYDVCPIGEPIHITMHDIEVIHYYYYELRGQTIKGPPAPYVEDQAYHSIGVYDRALTMEEISKYFPQAELLIKERKQAVYHKAIVSRGYKIDCMDKAVQLIESDSYPFYIELIHSWPEFKPSRLLLVESKESVTLSTRAIPATDLSEDLIVEEYEISGLIIGEDADPNKQSKYHHLLPINSIVYTEEELKNIRIKEKILE